VSATATVPKLEVHNASKNFGNLRAVSGVSMRVESGELRAIIGPNGAGKTTFFNLITGFFPPSSGDILLDGRNINSVPAAGRVKMGMGRTFQITEIFPELTVRENARIAVETGLGFSLRAWLTGADKQRVTAACDEVMALANLTSKADRLVGELSHGDQRSTEIAMALALKPSLLLLDEPTAGMGDEETYQITGLIRRLHRDSKYTIVLIEHDMRVVFHLADHISVLAEGRLLAEGTPEEIGANEHVQNAYLGKAE
jgi:branched-chain amino acid transport system ATP-binding protein